MNIIDDINVDLDRLAVLGEILSLGNHSTASDADTLGYASVQGGMICDYIVRVREKLLTLCAELDKKA